VNPKDILRWCAFAAAYFTLQAIPTALYGDSPALRGGNAVAVFLLLLEPRRHWPVLGPMLWLAAGAAREITHATSPWLVGGSNSLEVLAVAAVLHGAHGLSSPWYGSRQLPRLLLAAGAVPALTGAAAAAALQSGAGLPFAGQWLAWYLASALAYVTLTPLLLSLTNPAPRSGPAEPALGRRIAGIVLIAAACVGLLRQELYAPLVLLSFPLVVLCTWRYKLLGATTVVAVLAVTGGWFASRGVGALFHLLPSGTGMPARIEVLQLYLGATVLCGLPFAVLLAEQDKLWSQLRRKSDARAEFLAAMSHEIRTPMTGVLGMADLLAAQDLTRQQRRYVDSMRSSGRHLLNVINDILDFTRIETGQLLLETIDFRMSELVEQVRSLIHPIALEKGLAFDARLAQGSPDVVRGDPTRLRQILLNLAGNAVKFTSRGRVELQVSGEAGAAGWVRYRFQVRDTGIGIPADKLGILFAPFTQADRSIAREYGGSGLGLTISRRLAEAMGGWIDATSTHGQGSVFTVDIPLLPGTAAPRGAAEHEALAASRPQRILVAEDVHTNRDILRTALTARGHHLVFAHDGAEALAAVQREPFDMVLMDVQMPVMDGVEATRRIRALTSEVRHIPIIGLTANVMSQDQASYLGAGMDECLTKPIEWDQLAAAIARHAAAAAGQRPPQPQAAAHHVRALPGIDAPLLDERQIASLRALGDESSFMQLMQRIMGSVQGAVDEISAEATTGPIGATAHRLKGSAGMGGMSRISALAASLEDACARGTEVRGLVQQLTDALHETRAALVASGTLQP